MTREGAIGNLIHAIRWNDMPKKEALDMAIQALGQEPCDVFDEYGNYKYPSEVELTEPNTATSMPCDDAISRQALLDAFGFSEKTRKWGGDHSGYDTMMLYEIQDMIESAPSVKPQEPKTGHWIKDDITERSKSAYKHKCDRCGAYHRTMYDYCPSCGARMVEPQESEEI